MMDNNKININSENEDNRCLTLTDGTDISTLDYDYRKYLAYFSKKEIRRFFNSVKTADLLVKRFAEDANYLPPVGDYIFPNDDEIYLGYISQIRTLDNQSETYKYYDLSIGKTIKTIKARTNDFKNPVTQSISNSFGVFYDEEELFNHLVFVSVKNIKNSYGEIVFSRITAFRFLNSEVEKALIECGKTLFVN